MVIDANGKERIDLSDIKLFRAAMPIRITGCPFIEDFVFLAEIDGGVIGIFINWC